MTLKTTVLTALGLALGVFMGPVQAASRTLIARMAPESVRAEFFGLFALSGRVTSFAGPAALGWAAGARFWARRRTKNVRR